MLNDLRLRPSSTSVGGCSTLSPERRVCIPVVVPLPESPVRTMGAVVLRFQKRRDVICLRCDPYPPPSESGASSLPSAWPSVRMSQVSSTAKLETMSAVEACGGAEGEVFVRS